MSDDSSDVSDLEVNTSPPASQPQAHVEKPQHSVGQNGQDNGQQDGVGLHTDLAVDRANMDNIAGNGIEENGTPHRQAKVEQQEDTAQAGASTSRSVEHSHMPTQRKEPVTILCKHIDTSSLALRRYTAGLKWGRRVRRGEVTKRDDENGDDEQYDSKRRRLLPYPSCAHCHIALHRPYICLDCALSACFMAHVEQGTDCMRKHLQEAGHDVAFDIFDGTLYCSACDDIVYDAHFAEAAVNELGRAAMEKQTATHGHHSHAKGHIVANGAVGDDMDDPLIICKEQRGIYNLGATCFMNVILQSFLHNPLMRNYFLSDRHNAALCPARENCLACELDNLFIEFFSVQTRTAPFAPTNFLFCVYLARESTEISSGAGEHDAHELFIAALNGVHSALTAVGREHSSRSERLPMYPHGDQAHGLAASRSGTASNASEDGEDEMLTSTFRYTSDILCPCVVHRTFAGVLQSDVTCQRCGWTSTTHDPFLDLSLDIRAVRGRGAPAFDSDFDAKKKGKKQKDSLDKSRLERQARENSNLDDDQTVLDCLRRYCAIEKLAQSDYSCTQCGVPSQAVKQLSICRLPPVLCIQLKRFEHNTMAGTKIESRVKFPLTLDLFEFHTNSLHEDLDVRTEPDSYIYDLFSAVVHEGRLNTGHYYCFIKWREGWCIANDDTVRPATLDEVLSCRAYQLCYKRRALRNVRAEV